METFDAILRRRSVRKFNEKPVPDEFLQKLLEAAMAAPSACNKCPWEFYVVRNPELISALRSAGRYTDYNSSLVIVVAGNEKRSLAKKINDFWIQDCAAATENILLEAEELGLSACWCGLFPMVTPQNKTRKILGLEENIIPMALIHLGFSDEKPEPRTQFSAKYVHYFD